MHVENIRQDTISEIKSTDIISVQESQSVQDVITQLVSNGVSKVFVNNDSKPVGVISDKDIVRHLYIDRSKRSLNKIFASEIMNGICFGVETMTCKQAAQMMILNKISSLGIGSKEKMKGIITKSDLIRYYTETDPRESKVSDYMTISYFAAPHHTKIHEILKKMITCDISRVIVTDEESPIGMITIGDIFRASISTNKMSIVQNNDYSEDGGLWSETGFVGSQPAGEIMTEGLISVNSKSHMRDSAKLLLYNKIDCLGVKNGNDEMVGILNKTNVLYALADSK
jgi:CBS domain-containing protein